jgi:hypothetical protein
LRSIGRLAEALTSTVVRMAEFEQDPSANTGRFRAFVQQAEEETTRPAAVSRGMLIGIGVALAVILIVILVVTL